MASSFSRAIKSLKKIPGIGGKSAERIVFHLLETERSEVENFIQSLRDLLDKTVFCQNCGLISERSPCRICSSPKRDPNLICVVKNIQDAIHIERSKSYFGQYHILGGLLSPLAHIYEKDLQIDNLLQRVAKQRIWKKMNNPSNPNRTNLEIIFAIEQSSEADVTIELIQEKIYKLTPPPPIIFTRMAVGIPMGTSLEYIDGMTLKQSLDRRYPLDPKAQKIRD